MSDRKEESMDFGAYDEEEQKINLKPEGRRILELVGWSFRKVEWTNKQGEEESFHNLTWHLQIVGMMEEDAEEGFSVAHRTAYNSDPMRKAVHAFRTPEDEIPELDIDSLTERENDTMEGYIGRRVIALLRTNKGKTKQGEEFENTVIQKFLKEEEDEEEE